MAKASVKSILAWAFKGFSGFENRICSCLDVMFFEIRGVGRNKTPLHITGKPSANKLLGGSVGFAEPLLALLTTRTERQFGRSRVLEVWDSLSHFRLKS